MTYDTLFPSSSRTAGQCSTRAVNRGRKFCTSCTATCQDLWDVHATGVSLFTRSTTTATTRCHPRTEDTFHRQISAQCHHSATAIHPRSKADVERSRSISHHSVSVPGKTQWLNGNSRREPFNWTTVLIACFARNCHKLINCWYQKYRNRLTTH